MRLTRRLSALTVAWGTSIGSGAVLDPFGGFVWHRSRPPLPAEQESWQTKRHFPAASAAIGLYRLEPVAVSMEYNANMPVEPEEFQRKVKEIVREHYAGKRTPLLLAHLGLEIEALQVWPSDRGQRNLKQLITETCGPDLQIVWDRKSPAYIAVVTPDVRADVEAQIAKRFGDKGSVQVRLEDIAWPVLLAFCINVQNEAVYIRRTHPFRYEVGTVAADRAADYILVEPEFRRPGLRIDHPHQLPLSERRNLEGLIQRWAAVHGVEIDQFSKLRQEEKEESESGKTALDRLLAAQPLDLAQRIMIPADIAQILSRIH